MIATVVAEDVPSGYSWGWFGGAPVMKLVTVDREHRLRHQVTLERYGRRVFKAEGGVPDEVVAPLNVWVRAHRGDVETAWVRLMISRRWVRVSVRRWQVIVEAYPNSASGFVRVIDLPAVVGDRGIVCGDEDLGTDGKTAELVLGARETPCEQVRVSLPHVLWRG